MSENYCRNPSKSSNTKTIWCYTTDKTKRWDFCDPVTEETEKTKETDAVAEEKTEESDTVAEEKCSGERCSGYRGTQTKTKSGFTC